MFISVPRETNDSRCALTPAAVKKLCALKGVEVAVEKELSQTWKDDEYQAAGAAILKDRKELLSKADLIMRIGASDQTEIGWAKPGTLHISLLDPYNNRALVEQYAISKVDAVSLEMIPRTTLAQKMDVLSSQASLAGYAAVVIAAERLKKIFPMMMTPAGTISPTRVFIIGAGVAGLQAIATAKRMGARVEAFDTRPVVEEQVQSLGAKFLKVDLGETGQTKDGYAKALTEEQLAKQREAMARAVASADVVVTTAKLFGRKAPVIITQDMIKQMKPGSIIVDLAAGSGGNVEGVQVDKETLVHGVCIVGIDNLPGQVAVNASEMFSSNLINLFTHLWDEEKGTLKLGTGEDADEIVRGCLVTFGGEVVHPQIKKHYGATG